jgi:hypothetical protein
MVRFPHLKLTSGPTRRYSWDHGRVSCFIAKYALVLLTLHLEICLVLARQMPRQIARQGPRGHRMVRLHSLSTLIPPALKLMDYTDPLFYMHHGVSDN